MMIVGRSRRMDDLGEGYDNDGADEPVPICDMQMFETHQYS